MMRVVLISLAAAGCSAPASAESDALRMEITPTKCTAAIGNFTEVKTVDKSPLASTFLCSVDTKNSEAHCALRGSNGAKIIKGGNYEKFKLLMEPIDGKANLLGLKGDETIIGVYFVTDRGNRLPAIITTNAIVVHDGRVVAMSKTCHGVAEFL